MASVIILAHEDPLTKSNRHVVGDLRIVTGRLRHPASKYETGGFDITAGLVFMDKYIQQLIVGQNPLMKALASVDKISETQYKLKFFSAIGTELANESETMKEQFVPFIAIGK